MRGGGGFTTKDAKNRKNAASGGAGVSAGFLFGDSPERIPGEEVNEKGFSFERAVSTSVVGHP